MRCFRFSCSGCEFKWNMFCCCFLKLKRDPDVKDVMWGDVGVCSCFNRKTNHSNGESFARWIGIVHLQEVQVHNVNSIQSCLKYQKLFQKNKFPLRVGSSQTLRLLTIPLQSPPFGRGSCISNPNNLWT